MCRLLRPVVLIRKNRRPIPFNHIYNRPIQYSKRKPVVLVKYAFIVSCSFILGALVVEYKQHFYHETPEPIATLPDGGLYDGELRKGVLGGKGRISWPNESYYEGEFKDGLFHGDGILHMPTFLYQGDFHLGIARGEGIISYDTGDQYTGEVDFSLPHGSGVLEQADGTIYKGEFKEGLYHGQGEYISSDGDVYIGSFAKGMFHGDGVYTQLLSDANKQARQDSDTVEKIVYSGVFVEDQFTGEGIWLNGERRYEGEFKGWEFHGKGMYSDSRGTYTGDFVDGFYHGKGEYVSESGAVYTGEFENGRYHGSGTLISAFGDKYKGKFEKGRQHGKGTMTYAETLDGIKQFRGQWQYGRLIEADQPRLAIPSSTLVEYALYHQTEQLENAWSQLVDHDKSKIDLYFVGVAGDGRQGVFRREVDFIQSQFDAHYGTSGKSISLINGSWDYDKKPLATVTSIEQTLRKTAEKMDKENDILFVYLTSHGSREFTLQLSQSGFQLESLSAPTLAKVLKSLPVKHKVVVISACYAGGFITQIKDDYTMVIAAADADKTSFGCRDQASMTYFGEALFKDALPQSTSFSDAFYRARDIVRGREAKEGYEYSNPLIFKPKAIVAKLAEWRQQLRDDRQQEEHVFRSTVESTVGSQSLK